jgi:cell division protein FtsB
MEALTSEIAQLRQENTLLQAKNTQLEQQIKSLTTRFTVQGKRSVYYLH